MAKKRLPRSGHCVVEDGAEDGVELVEIYISKENHDRLQKHGTRYGEMVVCASFHPIWFPVRTKVPRHTLDNSVFYPDLCEDIDAVRERCEVIPPPYEQK